MAYPAHAYQQITSNITPELGASSLNCSQQSMHYDSTSSSQGCNTWTALRQLGSTSSSQGCNTWTALGQLGSKSSSQGCNTWTALGQLGSTSSSQGCNTWTAFGQLGRTSSSQGCNTWTCSRKTTLKCPFFRSLSYIQSLQQLRYDPHVLII